MSNSILDSLYTHLSGFISDLYTLQAEKDWPEGQEGKFWDRILLLLGEVYCALGTYNVTNSKTDLHRNLINAGLNFSVRWESWINGLQPASLKSGASKIMHEQLLRWVKGACKAYRIWLIDSGK